MKTKNIQKHKTCVLILVLILVLNMLLPMEALAAAVGMPIAFNIDGDGFSCMSTDTFESCTTVSFTKDENGYALYEGKYILLNDVPANASDLIQENANYVTGALPSTALDFTAPESLSMRVTQGHSDLTIDPCVITNTGSEDLKLSQVEITAASGWTVVASSTDFTTADSKNKIAFTAGGHDFSSGAYTPNEKIAAGGNTTLQLAGKISEKADLTNATQVASMVLTVEKVEIISFTISGTSYQAEAGMTWAEWVDSSYNVDGYINDKRMGICNREYGIAVGTNFAITVDPDDVITAEENYRGVVSGGAGN